MYNHLKNISFTKKQANKKQLKKNKQNANNKKDIYKGYIKLG